MGINYLLFRMAMCHNRYCTKFPQNESTKLFGNSVLRTYGPNHIGGIQALLCHLRIIHRFMGRG